MSNQVEHILEYLSKERDDSGLPWWKAQVDLAMQELSAHCTDDYQQSHIIEAFDKIADADSIDEKSFREALDHVRSSKEQKESATWKIFVPVQVDLNDDLAERPSLKVQDQTFSFCEASFVDQSLPVDLSDPTEFWSATRCTDWPAPEVYVTSEVEASSWQDAWRVLEPAFDVFKGFAEFRYSLGHRRWGGDGPRANLPHPKYYIAFDGNETVQGTTFVVSEHEVTQPIEITEDYIEDLKNESDGLKKVPDESSVDSLIVDALRLYSQAMDERFKEGRFLGFWQMLETVALSGRVNGKTSKIRSRVAWHGDRLGLPGTGIRKRLDKLADKRNDLVHRGIRNASDDDTNVLKLIAETAVDWLQSEREELSTKHHLDLYYQFRTTGNSSLDKTQDVLTLIKANRRACT